MTAMGLFIRHRFNEKQVDTTGLFFLMLWTACSRVLFWPRIPFWIGKDSSLYIHSLLLEKSYNVPMPGNIGFVLLGKFLNTLGFSEEQCYFVVLVLLSCIGVFYFYKFSALFLSHVQAWMAAFALSCHGLVWYYSLVIASYIVWMAVFAALLYYSTRFMLLKDRIGYVGMAFSWGIGIFFRQDMLVFGSFSVAVSLVVAKATWKQTGTVAAIAFCWGFLAFVATSVVLGGPEIYLQRVAAQHAFHETFSFFSKGFFEGLVRNAGKYLVMLAWFTPVPLCVVFFGWCMGVRIKTTPIVHYKWMCAGLLLPSGYFACVIFMGNAGLLIPAVLCLLWLFGLTLQSLERTRHVRHAVVLGYVCVALFSVAQFCVVPMLKETNTRNVVLNVSFLRYSLDGLFKHNGKNITDYGLDPSLSHVLRYLKEPEDIHVSQR